MQEYEYHDAELIAQNIKEILFIDSTSPHSQYIHVCHLCRHKQLSQTNEEGNNQKVRVKELMRVYMLAGDISYPRLNRLS